MRRKFVAWEPCREAFLGASRVSVRAGDKNMMGWKERGVSRVRVSGSTPRLFSKRSSRSSPSRISCHQSGPNQFVRRLPDRPRSQREHYNYNADCQDPYRVESPRCRAGNAARREDPGGPQEGALPFRRLLPFVVPSFCIADLLAQRSLCPFAPSLPVLCV